MNEMSEGYGFLRANKARHAEEQIGRSESLVAVLRLTQADLQPAEESLRVAKELFQAHEFSKALAAARQAEKLAITLDERYASYQKARSALEIRVAELRRLGLRTDALEDALRRAGERAATGSWEDNAFLPNYLEARVLLERAANEGRTLLVRAHAASNRIFLAELAINALGDLDGVPDPKAFAEGALGTLERALEDATKQLAVGDIEGAMRIATETESRAERLRAAFKEAGIVLDRTESRLGELRASGIITDGVERQIAYARDMRSKGLLEPALAMAARLSAEADRLSEAHGKALTGLEDAEVLYSRLEREGFQSYEADAAIKDARRALKEGNYTRALEHVERAHSAFARRRNAREALAKALVETQKRIELLEAADFPMLPDVQEVLGRAEREFRQGNYSGSSEDLRIATVLLSQAARPSRGAP